jgi:hypothetical protein
MIALMSRQRLFSLGSVVIAELAGATGDVGYQLQQQQQASDVSGAGLHAATGVLCADRAGRVAADRKYRASLTRRVGPYERYRNAFEAAIRTPASCARNSPRRVKEKPGTNHLCWDNKAVMITEKNQRFSSGMRWCNADVFCGLRVSSSMFCRIPVRRSSR